MYNDLKEQVKEHEGFVDTVYKDSLGFATIGYGHLVRPSDNFKEGVKYDRKRLLKVFDYDFQISYQDSI